MKVCLREIMDDVITGQIMNRVVCGENETEKSIAEIRVLLPSAISGGVIHHGLLGTALLKKQVPLRRITAKGDIVVKLSSPYDCAWTGEENAGLMIPSYCAILRGIHEETIDPYYLLGYLNSQYARKDLLMGVNASPAAMVRARALQELQIPILPIKEQKIIGEAYWSSCQRKAVLEKMAQKQQEISDCVIAEAVLEAGKIEK